MEQSSPAAEVVHQPLHCNETGQPVPATNSKDQDLTSTETVGFPPVAGVVDQSVLVAKGTKQSVSLREISQSLPAAEGVGQTLLSGETDGSPATGDNNSSPLIQEADQSAFYADAANRPPGCEGRDQPPAADDMHRSDEAAEDLGQPVVSGDDVAQSSNIGGSGETRVSDSGVESASAADATAEVSSGLVAASAIRAATEGLDRQQVSTEPRRQSSSSSDCTGAATGAGPGSSASAPAPAAEGDQSGAGWTSGDSSLDGPDVGRPSDTPHQPPERGRPSPNVSYCVLCWDGGELLLCDYCERAFHRECYVGPADHSDRGPWQCLMCRVMPTPTSPLERRVGDQMSTEDMTLARRLLMELYAAYYSSMYFKSLENLSLRRSESTFSRRWVKHIQTRAETEMGKGFSKETAFYSSMHIICQPLREIIEYGKIARPTWLDQVRDRLVAEGLSTLMGWLRDLETLVDHSTSSENGSPVHKYLEGTREAFKQFMLQHLRVAWLELDAMSDEKWRPADCPDEANKTKSKTWCPKVRCAVKK
ncbi:transcription intermediary factor 1-alpha-like [Pollicipes pollicipes]|uniref:transcription intermediary factor 1-alpha-like n=1 Tax=Pollicipes pollicipes TaxID=41117 RepID=UPI001885638E|nr:transcription intermediary factor 1-alpha-like [Pollicipes pollicipes]